MSDWAVGDLAVCVDDRVCTHCGLPAGVVKDGTYRVVGLFNNYDGLSLSLDGVEDATGDHLPGHDPRRFRKILPDKHEACESEFVDLLKRSRVPTETIVTVDRDGRAYLRDAA